MVELKWDENGSKIYETGVDRGVFYPQGTDPGVVWNGLTSVESGSIGGESKMTYIDGLLYENRWTGSQFKGIISAHTYPEEFEDHFGSIHGSAGLIYESQQSREFGLSYRTMAFDELGNEFYKIHLVYNASAKAPNFTSTTIGDSPTPSDFSWEITTRPEHIPAKRPTSKFVISSRETAPEDLLLVERILYGYGSSKPRLPSLTELINLLDDWSTLQIYRDLNTGLAELQYNGRFMDLQGDNRVGLYRRPDASRLRRTSINGIYGLD